MTVPIVMYIPLTADTKINVQRTAFDMVLPINTGRCGKDHEKKITTTSHNFVTD